MDRLGELLKRCSMNELKIQVESSLFELIRLIDENQEIMKDNIIKCIKVNITSMILKENFRMLLLSKMQKNDIINFKMLLEPKYRNEKDLNSTIERIAFASWKKNRLMKEMWFNYLNLNETSIDGIDTKPKSEIIISNSDFYELLDYQYMIKQKTLTLIKRNDVPRALIHMPTGTGKTKTTMHTIIEYYLYNIKQNGIVIWMAHTTELIEQAIDTFKKKWAHLGKGNIKILRFYGSSDLNMSDIDNGIVFAGYSKIISQSKNNPELFDKICERCRLLVVDEAHKSVAENTLGVIKEILRQKEGMLSRALIGLTATPGRSTSNNNENSLLVNFYENRIIKIDLNTLNKFNNGVFENYDEDIEEDVIRYLQERRILSRIIRVNLEYEGGISQDILGDINRYKGEDGDFTNKFISRMGTVVNRNVAIIDKLCELNRNGYPTIVFACSVEHGKIISNILSMKNIKNRCVFGDTSTNERYKAIQEYKDINNDMNILINCEVLTTGFDATNTKCIFITRPTKSIVLYSQMLGRGLRGPLMGGNEECLLVDIKDNLEEYSNESMAFNYFNNYWGCI